MKKIASYKNILFKTTTMFFIFYITVMMLFTGIYEKINIIINQNNIKNLIDTLEKETGQVIRNSQNNNYGYITDLNILYSDLENKDTTNSIICVGLFDDNKNLIAKSGDYIICGENLNNKKYIDIDKYINEEEYNEIYRYKRNKEKDKIYMLNIIGYEKGEEVIPKNIEVSVHMSNKDGSFKYPNSNIVKKYIFDNKNDNSITIQYKDVDFKHLKHEHILELKNVYPTYKNPYDDCSDCFKLNYINKIEDKDYYENYHGIILRSNEIIKKITINNIDYYITFKSMYNPLKIAFVKLIPVYIFGFIICLSVVVIFSNGFYKIYKEQYSLNENRRKLTSSIVHELKTPLGIIRTYGEGIKENISEEKKDHYLDIIINETYRMDNMVMEILDLSKLDVCYV